MSVVAAKVYEDCVKIAADSIVVKGNAKRVDTFTKLINENDMIIGSTGLCEETSAMWQFIRNHKPLDATVKDVMDFIVEFVTWKAATLKMESSLVNEYLLCYKGHLFSIERMFVCEVTNYAAIGAGEDFAMAALCLDHTVEDAVEVAAELHCYVAKPIVSYRQERE